MSSSQVIKVGEKERYTGEKRTAGGKDDEVTLYTTRYAVSIGSTNKSKRGLYMVNWVSLIQRQAYCA